MRILITGSRKWRDRATIYRALDEEYEAWLPLRDRWELFTVIHGKAKGADTIAKEWTLTKPYAEEEGYDAHWDLLGAQAGHERNARMIKAGKPVKVLAFPLGGPGTRNCMKLARKAGIPVRQFKPQEETQ
jgi:YspA, cpYpsA-related SLOG family